MSGDALSGFKGAVIFQKIEVVTGGAIDVESPPEP